MIKYIAHTSDWHLHPTESHTNFLTFIDAFIKSVDERSFAHNASPKEVLIAIMGDLTDAFTKMSNEQTLILINTITRLCNHFGGVLMISGNHDLDEKNFNRLCSVKMVYEILKPYQHNLYYFEQSTMEVLPIPFVKPTIFANFSIRQHHAAPNELKKIKESKKYEYIIGCFHASLNGYQTFMNHYEGESERTAAMFNGCDLVMMGDIHRQQVFHTDTGNPCYYAGSPYQINVGESITGHGYMWYNLLKKVGSGTPAADFVELPPAAWNELIHFDATSQSLTIKNV